MIESSLQCTGVSLVVGEKPVLAIGIRDGAYVGSCLLERRHGLPIAGRSFSNSETGGLAIGEDVAVDDELGADRVLGRHLTPIGRAGGLVGLELDADIGSGAGAFGAERGGHTEVRALSCMGGVQRKCVGGCFLGGLDRQLEAATGWSSCRPLADERVRLRCDLAGAGGGRTCGAGPVAARTGRRRQCQRNEDRD